MIIPSGNAAFRVTGKSFLPLGFASGNAQAYLAEKSLPIVIRNRPPSVVLVHDVEKISLDLSHGPATKVLAVT
jgi:hypothetical protein